MRRRWQGKLVLKGILCVEDARRAVDVGADGIVLSNHGGRQLDSCVSGVELLPAVSAEVGDRLDVLVDGGFRRGSDVLKAHGARRARRDDRPAGAVRPCGRRRGGRGARARHCCAPRWSAR